MTASPANTELYQAYSRCYATEANRRLFAFGIDIAFAIAALVLTVLTTAEWVLSAAEFLTTWLPLAALLWLVVREFGVLSIDVSHRRSAVNIQEQLDLINWKGNDWPNHWNQLLAGEPVTSRTIKQLSLARPNVTMPPDYWIDTTGLPGNDAALFRVEQTAAWGAEGHRRYALLNLYPSIGGLLVVVAVALIVDVSARETAAAIGAIAPFLVGRIQSSREHSSLAGRRELLERHIQAVLDPKRPSCENDVRAAQDELYRLRMETRRIPNWLYNYYAAGDRSSIVGALTTNVKVFRSSMRP